MHKVLAKFLQVILLCHWSAEVPFVCHPLLSLILLCWFGSLTSFLQLCLGLGLVKKQFCPGEGNWSFCGRFSLKYLPGVTQQGATLRNLGVQSEHGKKMCIECQSKHKHFLIYKAFKSCKVRYIEPHEFDQMWWSIISTDRETWWNTNLFVLAAVMFNISSWITNATLEANITLNKKPL